MEKLQKMKCVLLGAVAASAIFATIPTMAASGSKTIEVFYNNIKLMVDGKTIVPTDGNGNTVEPFIYNGTTYLPVRAVGEAIGKPVSWDGVTSSIHIGKTNTTQKMVDVIEPYNGTDYGIFKDGESVSMGGIKYYNGYKLYPSSFSISSGSRYEYFFNLNSEYSNMTGLFGVEDGCHGGKIGFYGDGKLIKTLEIEDNELPTKFDVDLTGVLKLEIRLESHSAALYYPVLCLAEVEIR